MSEEKLTGRAALVTGARRGIGRAIALALAGAGARLAVSDAVVEDKLLEKVAGEIRGAGGEAFSLRLDIARKRQVERGIEKVAARFGGIDILVNCAGVWIPGETLVDCRRENWDKVIDTNLRGTWFCCQVAGRIMIAQKRGTIINLSSQVGLNPGVGGGAYSISKAAIIMLTRQLALELAPYNIRVNAIAPGVVRTDFNKALWQEPKREQAIAAGIPLGRLATAEDIARTALFLASDESAYITGDVIKVDGGWQVSGTPPRTK
jgi:NAD(P)-dependent dehydrogenase (short-subunit alcohol dehydrogenase family)